MHMARSHDGFTVASWYEVRNRVGFRTYILMPRVTVLAVF